MKSSKKLIKIALKKIQDKTVQNSISGVPSGFIKIDEFTNGWQPGQLIVIAARPGMGKTAFTKSMILNTAIKFNQAVSVFSLYNSSIQYINMMIASEANISYSKLANGKLESCELNGLKKKLIKLSRAPIFIDDTPSISLADFKTKVLQLISEEDIKLIVIDYLQLMTFQKLSIFHKTQEIDIISRNLKKLAEELNLPIIILSELPKTVEKRKRNKRPELSDLRKITEIERYADIVAFLYRPEYYGIKEWDNEVDTTRGQAEFIIAKNRNGWLNNFRLKFNSSNLDFSDFDNT